MPIVLVALTACGGGSPGSPGGTGAAAGSGGVATTGGGGSGTTTTSSGGSGGAPTTTGEPCGNGVVDAQETCDVAIPVGEPGACPASCNDGVTCTTDTLVDAGSCSAACAHADVSACTNGDGCCPAGCPADTDCAPLSRIKHSVITDSGQEMWSRNGYWDGAKYTNWTDFSGQGLTQLVPELGANQAYRGVDHVVRADGTVKITMLQMDGKKAWSRYGTWDGAGYSGWTPWSDQFGDLSQIIPTLPAGQTYRSYDHVVFPDGKIKQTLLTSDGTKIWYRSATWNGSAYDNWTDWTDVGGDLTGLLPGQGASQSFRSFNHVVLVDQRMKQLVLAEDGHKAWYRYATWDGAAYGNWTAWTSQFGDLTQLLPGKGNNQAYLGFDEAALAGAGAMGGCQNGCDDSDPCTVDSCVGNTCQHAAKVCDDADVCTVDLCVDGACQYSAQSCDDGNECTDDFCSAGCQHSNNAASCPGGTCQGGQCVGGGGSGGAGGGSGGGGAGGGPSCECTTGCTDSCGQPCNDGASCAANATCQGGSCLCAGGPFCGGVCCPAGNSCNGGKCCPPDSVICAGKCGTVTHACGKTVNCGGCPAPAMCCPGNYCDETCQ